MSLGSGGLSRVRIIHLIPVDGIGGVEIAAKSMVDRRDLSCHFDLRFIESQSPIGRSFSSIARVIIENWKTFKYVRSIKPDIVLFSLWRSVPLAFLLRIFSPRMKFVHFVHSDTLVHICDAVMSWIGIHISNEVWGDSAATLEARGVPRGRSRVISFVTARREILDKSFVGPRLVSWGRLHHQKGYDRAIRLAGLMSECGVDVQYDLYGPDGGERDRLIALTKELGIGHRINFPGSVSKEDLPKIARNYAFFLQLSRAEGMGMATVEAMQLGLVPVTTAVGQMQHYVGPETGVIVIPEEMGAAVKKIEALVGDPAQWKQRSQAAMRFWEGASLYADDVCCAAMALISKPVAKNRSRDL